jgi:drug/metabolite transporter (DMT)-like permease
LLSLLFAALGAALLLGSSYELSREHLVGDLFCILAGLFYAFYLLAIDRARQTMAPMPVLALVTIAGAIPLLLFAIGFGETLVPRDWTPLLLLSLGSQVIGQGLLVYSIGHLSPVVSASASSRSPRRARSLAGSPMANASGSRISLGRCSSAPPSC